MDFLDKRIFVRNFNDILKSGDLIRELEIVTSALKRELGDEADYPTINKKQIQRLKQVVWILETNYNKKGGRF